MDADDYRAASLEQWERSAEGWQRRREELQRSTAVVSHWMVEAIAPQPGQVVLELAAGPGDTGLLAAELVAPGGRLICSDFAEPMLEAARERAAELGADNVELRVLNAESLKLDAASVDAVLCRWGYMLMADPMAALQETRRVLRPGGRLALAAWDDPQANPWVSLIAGRARGLLDAPPPDPESPHMFAFAPPGRLQRLLEEAGFGEIEVVPLAFEVNYDSPEHWWEMQLDLGRPLADMVASLTPELRQRLQDEVRDDAARFATEDGRLRFPARTLVASATA
jgi:ubiquinone/menaquinone biosynthesis C-methylase UbiE